MFKKKKKNRVYDLSEILLFENVSESGIGVREEIMMYDIQQWWNWCCAWNMSVAFFSLDLLKTQSKLVDLVKYTL